MNHLPNPVRRIRENRRRRRFDEEALREYRSEDAAESAASVPPDDEKIRLRGIWLADCYPVSQVEDLLQRLRALNPRRRGLSSQLEGAIRTLEATRVDPLRGGTSGQFPIVHPGSTLFALSDAVELDLPRSVDYMMGWLDAEMSALPTLVLQVHLTDDASQGIDRELRRNYATRAERTGSWTTFHSPTNQKRDAIVHERLRITRELTSWMRQHFPGFFASSGLDGVYPMIQFWTSDQRRPFEPLPEEEQRPRVRLSSDYIELLRWDRAFERWIEEDIAGGTLRPVDHLGDEPGGEEFALELIARTDDLFADDDLKAYGDRTTHGLMNRLHYSMLDVLSGWARRCALRRYEREFAAARHRLRIATRRKRRGETRRADLLADTELRLLQLRADLEPVLAHVGATKGERRGMRQSSTDFLLQEPLAHGETVIWQVSNSETVVWLAERLERTVSELAEVSGAIIGVVSARVNLRLQRHVRFFTLVAAIVAGIALYLQVKS